MTRANSPQGGAIQDMEANRATYRTCVVFFCYTTNTAFVHCTIVHCTNAGRLLSKFLSNPGENHYEAAMYAIGFLSYKQDDYLEYKRSVNFDGVFRLFTMVDADLGGDHTKGPNANSVMSSVTFFN
jgi:hypothetical protein